jgi:hypothetical protein
MLIALLAVLGVDLIVIVGLVAVALIRKRWVVRQPGAFRGAIRVAGGEIDGLGPKWGGGYGRWVREVLVWTTVAVALVAHGEARIVRASMSTQTGGKEPDPRAQAPASRLISSRTQGRDWNTDPTSCSSRRRCRDNTAAGNPGEALRAAGDVDVERLPGVANRIDGATTPGGLLGPVGADDGQPGPPS